MIHTQIAPVRETAIGSGGKPYERVCNRRVVRVDWLLRYLRNNADRPAYLIQAELERAS